MLKVPLLKADLSRLASASTIFSIGKFLPLLIAPVVLLWGYGKAQAARTELAEYRVEQLTQDVHTLSKSLALAEQYNAKRTAQITAYTKAIQVLSNDESEVLTMLAPIDIVDLLRPYSADD